MAWVKQVGELLPDYYTPETIPEVEELDELETFGLFRTYRCSFFRKMPKK